MALGSRDILGRAAFLCGVLHWTTIVYMMNGIKSGLLVVVALALGSSAWASPIPNPVPNPVPTPSHIPPAHVVYAGDLADNLVPPDAPGSEMTDRGRNVKGLYVPYPRLRSWKPKRIVRWVKEVGADAVILDIKDDRGRVTFTRDLPHTRGTAHGEVRRMAKVVSSLKEKGVYVIGRLVCFKDNQLVRIDPSTAIRDHRTGKPWRDHGKLAWVDPHSPVATSHIVSVAVAAQELGFDEIQLDYIRFPVESSARHARFPNREGDVERHQAIAAVLSAVDRAIELPLSIDVFGLTAYHSGDRDGLGQSLEHLAPYVDAISPMVYLANWPKRYWDKPKPKRTRALVEGAVRKIRERLGDDIAVRPLLQAFRWRAKNYSRAFINNQIDAAQAGNCKGYLFWNQGGNYHKVTAVWDKREE